MTYIVTPSEKQLAKVRARLEAKSEKSGNCLLWLGFCDGGGYGRVWWLGSLHQVHRLGWFLYKGVWPSLNVLHHCDTRNCWAEDHLFEGTQQDNVDDMIAKGRAIALKGEGNGRSCLTEDNIREIRRLSNEGHIQNFIAAKFNITHTTVWKIINRRSWKHVD